jgi:hypothetical protein
MRRPLAETGRATRPLGRFAPSPPRVGESVRASRSSLSAAWVWGSSRYSTFRDRFAAASQIRSPWGRGQAATFWAVAVLASAQEPALWGLGFLQHTPPPTPYAFAWFNMALAFAINMVEVYGFRRFGWPAAILFRLGLYATARVFLPYLLPHASALYPGPH